MKIPALAGSLLASLLALASARADVPIFIFAGQSNMGGYQTDTHQLSPPDLAEQPNVLFYGDNCQNFQPVNLGERPTQSINVSSNSGFGPEATVGRDIVAAGVFPKVLEIKFTMNGSGSDSFIASPDDGVANKAPIPITSTWAPDIKVSGPQVSLYQFLIDRIKAARATYTTQTGEKTYIAGFFWMQGESDANSSPEVAKMYDRNFQQMILALRRDLETPALPVVFGRIRHGTSFPNDLVVRAAQDNAVKPGNAEFVPHAFEVDTDSFEMSGDTRHYSSSGVMALGHAMAKGYQEVTKPQ